MDTGPGTETCCDPDSPIDPADFVDDARRLKAIADPNRLAMLAIMETGPVCVCDFVSPLGLGQPTVSHHLKLLHDAGLVVRERKGQWVYYSLDRAGLEALAGRVGSRSKASLV